jgi:hypothetical protein
MADCALFHNALTRLAKGRAEIGRPEFHGLNRATCFHSFLARFGSPSGSSRLAACPKPIVFMGDTYNPLSLQHLAIPVCELP